MTMAVTADLAKVLDKAYEEKTLTELVDAPVAALAGVSSLTTSPTRATPNTWQRTDPPSRLSGLGGVGDRPRQDPRLRWRPGLPAAVAGFRLAMSPMGLTGWIGDGV
jgi:hypothetical protein